jgi:hypothetical protein
MRHREFRQQRLDEGAQQSGGGGDVLEHRGAGGIAVAGRDRVEDALVLLSRVPDRFLEYGDGRGGAALLSARRLDAAAGSGYGRLV